MAMSPAMLTWRNLHLADAVICDELNARLAADTGCSLTEHDLMAWLAAAPGQRLRMADLAARLRVTPGGLTRIADRLATRGWIERDRPPGNRREVHVTLTRTGTAAQLAARSAYSRVLRNTLARHLNAHDLETLGTITGKLLGQLAAEHELHCLPATR
jgi:DNA-binding MarR family transcriptional regulator